MDPIDDIGTGSARIRTAASVVELAWAGASHSGHVRRLNEDSWTAASPVFVVCDGMGGHASGEVASALATGVVSSLSSGNAVPVTELVRAVTDANRIILQHSGGGERSMGTTLTGVAVVADQVPRIAMVNVGDSRTYLLRDGALEQVSVDHSQVQELIDQGFITEAEAATHPERNVVTRALGIDATVEVDVRMRDVRPGDRWLSCSDGLSGELPAAAMRDLLCDAVDGASAVRDLIEATLSGPAKDNITVLVVDVVRVDDSADPDRTDPRRSDITEPNRRMLATVAPESSSDLIDAVPFGGGAVAEPLPPATSPLIETVPPAGWSPPDPTPEMETHDDPE